MTLETWDSSDIWSEWCLDKITQREKEEEKTTRKKDNKKKLQKEKIQKDKIMWNNNS